MLYSDLSSALRLIYYILYCSSRTAAQIHIWGKLYKDSIEFPKHKQEWGLRAGTARYASFFSDFALEKSLFPFHVSGGCCPITGLSVSVDARTHSSQTKWQKFTLLEFRRLVKFKIRKSKLLPVIDHRIGILNQLHVWGAVTYHQRHTWLNNLVSATPPCALNSFDTWDENMAIDLQHDIPK